LLYTELLNNIDHLFEPNTADTAMIAALIN